MGSRKRIIRKPRVTRRKLRAAKRDINNEKRLVLNDWDQSSVSSFNTDISNTSESGSGNSKDTSESDSGTSKSFDNNTETTQTIDIKTATTIVPIFNGSSDALEDFCRACQDAYESVSESNKIFMLKVIRSKCTGEAEKYLRGRAKYTTLDAFLTDLKKGFGLRDNYNSLLIDLSNTVQKESETVRQYGIRVNELLARLVNSVHSSFLPEIIPGTEAGVRDNAVKCFIEGLRHDSVADRVRSTKPNNLEEALNVALEMEKSQDWRDNLHSKRSNFRAPVPVALVAETSTDSIIRCFACNESGHIARFCPTEIGRQNARKHYLNRVNNRGINKK